MADGLPTAGVDVGVVIDDELLQLALTADREAEAKPDVDLSKYPVPTVAEVTSISLSFRSELLFYSANCLGQLEMARDRTVPASAQWGSRARGRQRHCLFPATCRVTINF